MKLRAHIDRVGMRIPTVEVRFENMTVNVECLVDGRALPILVNSAKNFLDTMLGTIGLTSTRKTKLTILKDDSGIIKPPRLTLLLGQPGSRKSTLLLALVGRLDKELKASGSITYNGHSLDEFVPQKNSAYISQNDLHVGVMTVRETLNFSTKCQGVGSKYEMLYELDKREKEARIVPDTEVDIFMKETSVEDVKSSLQTDYSLMILGLDICAETILGDEMIRGPIRIDYSIFLPKYVRSKFQVI